MRASGKLVGREEAAIRSRRRKLGLHPVYKRVDTCAAEFSTSTAYLYSTYEEECEANPTSRRKIMILGGGPRIASDRASNSTIAACTPPWRCAKTASKRSW